MVTLAAAIRVPAGALSAMVGFVGMNAIAVGYGSSHVPPQSGIPSATSAPLNTPVIESPSSNRLTAGDSIKPDRLAMLKPPTPVRGLAVADPFQLPFLALTQKSLLVRSATTSTTLP